MTPSTFRGTQEETMKRKVYAVLKGARMQEKWVATELLAPYGLHTTLLYMMQDMGHVVTQSTPQGKAIKLTLEGYKHATQLLSETN